MRRFVAAAALCALLLGSLSGCWLDQGRRDIEEGFDNKTDAAFYSLPADLPAGRPGEIIRSKRLLSAPAGARAWRVIYHSTDMDGKDIPVSTIVIVPDDAAPVGGRTIVSWAHPTTGSAQRCGPSVGTDPFLGIEGFDQLLLAGYAITATDYQGMSVAGPSSYLLGVTEGNNVLDAARAARNLPGLTLSNKLLLWGHSQGGQAALFAAQQARDYAPDLHLEGVAVAAPAADLNTLLSDDIAGISGVTIASYAFASFEAAYASRYPAATLDAILTPAGAVATPKMAALCLLAQHDEIHAIADPLMGKYVTNNPATTEPWATLLRENSAGASPIDAPVFVGQGLADVLVIPAATRKYVAALCAAGEAVTFAEYKGVSHAFAGYVALPDAMAFFDKVSRGITPSNCP